MPTKVILDVDTGTDDAVALMVAALSDDLELVGATTVNGNTTIDYTTENTIRVFDWIGRPETPVFRGLDRPIARSQVERGMAGRIHGDLLDLPPASHGATLQPEHAVDWLIETYLASDGDIVLCPLGPLTNVAMAIQKERRILEAIPEIVIMGGAHHQGNVTPSAEFNFWLDPEAARVVVDCGRPIRMVPLDATHRALVSTDDAQRLRDLGTPAGEAAARFVLQRIDGYDATQPMPHRPGAAPVHDALAVCAIVDPTILTTALIPVEVEVHAELSVGRTVCDFRSRTSKQANVQFGIDADESKFVRMLVDILGQAT
jgi:inosine-uridine nucleoside N-ribohydrolase